MLFDRQLFVFPHRDGNDLPSLSWLTIYHELAGLLVASYGHQLIGHLSELYLRIGQKQPGHCQLRDVGRECGSVVRFAMPSVDPVINAMTEVNKELETHFTHLSNPELDASDRKAIGIHAAEGVRRGFTVMLLHQRFFNLMLDELEEQALAVQGYVEANPADSIH